MEHSMLNNLLFDPAYLIIGLGVVTFLLLIAVIVCIVKTKKMYKKYDLFMRGKDAESLEDSIKEKFAEIDTLKAEDQANKEKINELNHLMLKTFQKIGLVKYDAFGGMGGQSSFALAMLDQTEKGYVMNAIHSREGCYIYIKEIINGECKIALGKEEEEALRKALALKR